MKKFNLKRRRIVIIAVVIILIFVVYQVAFKKNGNDILLADVVRGNVVQEVSETGQVKQGEEINLNFKAAGRINQIYVKEGDHVVSGQDLVKLDIKQLQTQLAEAQSSLGVIEAKKGDAQISLISARQELQDTIDTQNEKIDKEYGDANVIISDVNLKAYNALVFMDYLVRTYFSTGTQESAAISDNRIEINKALSTIITYASKVKSDPSRENITSALNNLADEILTIRDQLESARGTIETSNYRDIVSTTDKSSLDTHKSSMNSLYSDFVGAKSEIAVAEATAKAAINSAEATISSLENQLDVNQNGLYESQVNEAKSKVQLLIDQINDATLKSPVDGQVARINKRVGETAQPGEVNPVVSVLPSIPFEVQADIYEEDVVSITLNDQVDIDLIPFPDRLFRGKVLLVDPAEKIIDGVIYYRVTIVFEDEVPSTLKSGMTADINIKTGMSNNVLIVPEEAINKDNGKDTVRVKNGRRIETRDIALGLEGSDGMVEVLSGLKEGEKVIIEQ